MNLKPFINVEETSDQQIIGIADFLRMVWAWLTGTLPSLAIDEVRERVRTMGDRVDDRINRRAGLNDESRYRIRFLGRKRQPRKVVEEDDVDEFQRQDWRFVAAEPSVWSSLRQLCFGLLDGGDVHDDAVAALLGVGGQRYVLGDQRLISPPPGVSLWQPSDEVRAAGIGPGPVRSAVDVEWAAGWTEALGDLTARLRVSLKDEKGEGLSNLDALDGFVEGGRPGPRESSHGVANFDDERVNGADHHPLPVPELLEGGQDARSALTSLQLLNTAEDDLASLLAARQGASRSLLWGLGEHLYGEYQKAVQHVAGLREQVCRLKRRRLTLLRFWQLAARRSGERRPD